MKRHKILFIFIIVIFVITAFMLGDLWISSNYIVIRSFTTVISKENGKTIRAVIISDLHDHEFGSNNKNLVDKIVEIDPDVIFMDGDMLNENSEDSSVPCDLIEQVKDVAPVYYALGNHENAYISNGHPELISQLEESGAAVLDKIYVDIDVDGTQIRVGGMYEYAFGLNGNSEAMAASADRIAFLQDFQNTDRLKIMMSHRPDSFIFGDASKVWDVDIVISGHDHGGQVVLPFLGGVFGGDQGYFPEYVHGLYEKDNFQIFITSGLGSNKQKLPRFNNPPEIAVLNIEC